MTLRRVAPPLPSGAAPKAAGRSGGAPLRPPSPAWATTYRWLAGLAIGFAAGWLYIGLALL